MTLVDILKEYDKTRIEYAENGYGDTRKKLLVAFECLGLYDLEIFKSENGKDYCFVESGKEYIFYLLDRETSPLFRNIKGNKMTMDNYVELTEEVERLFEFVKIHTRSEEEYKRVVSEISSNVNYPIIKRHAKFQTTDYIFSTYYESMVRNDGMVTQISNWEYLTADDKAKLMDELIIATRKWVNLVERLGEYRADEEMEDIDNISIADIKLLAFVDDAISEEYCKKYYEMCAIIG